MEQWDEPEQTEPSDDELREIEASSDESQPDVEGDDPRWLLYNAEPLLSAEEERALFKRYHAGRVPRGHYGPMTRQAWQARERLIVANTRLVRRIAQHFIVRGSMTREDLEMEGIFGLMRAVERFDPSRGYKLSTMATWWIRQAISRALDDQPDLIREPVHLRTKRRRAVRYGEEEPRPAWGVVSLDAPILNDFSSEDPDSSLRANLVADPVSSAMADMVVERVHTHQTLYLALGKLSMREQYVIALRYGLANGGDGMTLEEIGQSMSITRERVRQIEAKAMTALRLSLMATADGDVCLRMLALVKGRKKTSTSGRQVSSEPQLVKQRAYNQRKRQQQKLSA